MNKIILYILKIFTKLYLRKNKIEVVGITGSAGKTTTKSILSKLFNDEETYVPSEGYNTEIGIPLTVFKEQVPSNLKNIFSWIAIILPIKIKFFKRAQYKKIILEFGADKAGDISYFMSFIKPKISIVTSILPVHLEHFEKIEAVEREKGKLVEFTDCEGIVILNNDDDSVRKMSKLSCAKVFKYGQRSDSDLKFSDLTTDKEGNISFDLHYKEETRRVTTNFIAPQLIPSILSAFSAAISLGRSIEEVVEKLKDIYPEKGRMNRIEGMCESIIIDDSYNANPASTIAALDVLNGFNGRKIAVLGSMNELGKYEKEGHEIVAKKAVEIADILLFVGENKKIFLSIAIKKMNKKSVHYFDGPFSAGEYLKIIIKKGDIVLFKGSQNGVFLEEAIKKIILKPEEAQTTLVRRSKMWQDKKERFQKTLEKEIL